MLKSWGRYLCLFGTLLAVSSVAMAANIISSGAGTIPGTYSFDFDAGMVDNFFADPTADVFWEQFTSATRALEPENGAMIVNIGVISFASVTVAQLEGLSYGTTGIDGSNASNVLVPGDVFAVHTNAGNFAKVLVTGPFDSSSDNGLPIQWETDSVATPESASGILVVLGLTTLALVRRVPVRT